MPESSCTTCGAPVLWTWEDAFDKFGYGDGDGLVMTEYVALTLEHAGFDVRTSRWGLHNTIINSIERNGVELIPHERIKLGYADPRDYLPEDIVKLLDARLSDGEVVS